MEAGQFEWQMSDTKPKGILEGALSATVSLFQKDPPIRLVTTIPSVLPAIHVDGDRLTQVIVNLISNAVKFCDSKNGRVEVNVEARDGSLLIAVVDNGNGIAAADQKKIFDKFQQASDGSKGQGHGTGLGLPISQQIIEHFGGRLWVENKPGNGATFSFAVPIN